MFTGLKHLYVDTRGLPWAVNMVRDLRNVSHAQKILAWTKTGNESEAGWNVLEQRIFGQTIRLPNCKEMIDEFFGVTKKPIERGAGWKVVDRDRRKSHKDITESIAICCYLVGQQQIGAGRATLSGRHTEVKKKIASVIRQSKSYKIAGGKFGDDRY